SQTPNDIFHGVCSVEICLPPGGLIELRFGEHLLGVAGQEQEHGKLTVTQMYLLPCFEHCPKARVNLNVPKGEHIVRSPSQFKNFRPPAPECVHDGLEHTAVRVNRANDDDLFH